MKDKNFINKYFKKFKFLFDSLNKNLILEIKKQILITKKKNGKIILFGNGGSASTADHIAIDLTKNAKVRSTTFNNSSLITCFSNDYGFENWMSKSASYYINKKDLVILISASGNSKNLVNVAKYCKKKKIKLITLTGFKKNNKLSKFTKTNLWINSMSYNIVEILHFIVLATIVDMIIGKDRYHSKR
tara:strand:+ start:489 stop:1052 length:564 start_codon:yes stop_codon:yes gene_type:complete